MLQQMRRWSWAAVAIPTLLVGLGLGALLRFPAEDTPGISPGKQGDHTPPVSAPPGSSRAGSRAPSDPVKAFAEIDGRFYRIIVAGGPGRDQSAPLWSAALSDDEAPR